MIKSITVLSYNAMMRWALSEFRIPSTAYIVSICDPCEQPIFENGVSDRVLALQFWDADPAATDVLPMSQLQAAQIVDLICKAQADPEEVPFLANCMAGRSRSGAVGEFAQRVAGIRYDVFKKANPEVQPNGYVLQMLMRIGRKRGVV